eukprot:3654316-Amphidinium_carterae.1
MWNGVCFRADATLRGLCCSCVPEQKAFMEDCRYHLHVNLHKERYSTGMCHEYPPFSNLALSEGSEDILRTRCAISKLIVCADDVILHSYYREGPSCFISSASAEIALQNSSALDQSEKQTRQASQVGSGSCSKEVLLEIYHSPCAAVLAYDLWTLLPTKHALEGWSSLICNAIFSAVSGPKDKCLLASVNPHQLNMTAIFVVSLAKDALHMVLDEPLTAFFEVPKGVTFQTPLSAFVALAEIAGFTPVPEGMYHQQVNSLVMWPPSSMEALLHDLRVVFRQWMLVRTRADLQRKEGDVIDAEACKPMSTLSRTQHNFLLTLQSHAHRALQEVQCG